MMIPYPVQLIPQEHYHYSTCVCCESVFGKKKKKKRQSQARKLKKFKAATKTMR